MGTCGSVQAFFFRTCGCINTVMDNVKRLLALNIHKFLYT